MHTCIHAYMHAYITLHYTTLHYNTLHYIQICIAIFKCVPSRPFHFQAMHVPHRPHHGLSHLRPFADTWEQGLRDRTWLESGLRCNAQKGRKATSKSQFLLWIQYKSHFYLWGLNTMTYQANQCTWYHISECSVNPDGLHAPKEAALSCQVALFEAPTMAMLPTAHAACQGPWRHRGAALGGFQHGNVSKPCTPGEHQNSW